jgi:DNA-binding beta-propeller fold protein YncE
MIAALAGFALAGPAAAEDLTPTGQALTPTEAQGAIFQPLNPDLPDAPSYTAGQASAVALSPDGRTLLILTSGFNRMFGPDGAFVPSQSSEYVFVYDVSGAAPVKRQVLKVPDSFIGLAWAPSGERFYVAGGDDDDVLEFARAAGGGGFAPARTFALGHKAGLGLKVQPEAAGLAVSPDGRRLMVANLQNDSVSLISLATGRTREIDLRPGAIDPKRRGEPGGTFPRAVAFVSDRRAYVASERDREVIAIDLSSARPRVGRRIRTEGQPVALLAGRGGRLFAALDNTDAVAVIDTRGDRIIGSIPTAAPKGLLGADQHLGGAGANALALSPDGRSLLVTDGGENALAVIALDAKASGLKPRKVDDDGDGDDDAGPDAPSAVVGLIPTGWYPTAVAARPDGRQIYVVNGKSAAGPNPGGCRHDLKIGPTAEADCRGANQYVWQLEKAGFLTLPVPSGVELGRLTGIVARNDRFPGAGAPEGADPTMAFLRAHIRHVIYIVKENRTYDQVLGDLEVGNGDPNLAVFGRAMTPNQHALARQFVDLDAFFDSGESSNTGWNWTTAARTNDFTEREAPVNYAARGLQYDQEGDNRNLNMGLASEAKRAAVQPTAPADPDILPGARDVAAPDGPDGAEGQGYIWDGALRAGLTVRNWGFYGDLTLYAKAAGAARTPRIRDPHQAGVVVFTTTKAALAPFTDPYFRGFDQGFPDYWRFKEWEREFDGFVAKGEAPNLMLLRLPHDHTGEFAEGIDGINSVEAELADNDYAVGLVVQKVAESRFAKDTLILVVEDDAQDGPDHVDAHRSIALIVGPYVRQGAVIQTRYTTVNLVRTLEAVLGIAPLGLNDALARPMSDIFDVTKADWSFKAQVPAVLRTTTLPLPPEQAAEAACPARPARSAAYWTAAMAGQDFSREDHLDTVRFNHALWRGLKGDAPYPAARDGRDLSQDRAALLAAAGVDTACD